MEKSPMNMNYKSGPAPKGVPAIGLYKGNKSETGPKVMKDARAAGAMYKKPGALALRGKGARDMSSSNTGPSAQSASDKNRYVQAKQPTQYSNAGTPKATRFVC